ncbi:MAG: GAF and ANTAR domain-containing protein [Candidatus Omnitrophica bacterium]|nr:GAF and ANTAR domain-containing protein [Candidatus Omnitrophota bacterium]
MPSKKNREKDTRADQVEALKKISEAITSDLYLDDVLKLIVSVTAQVMKSKICSLMLLDKEKKELIIKATQSISEEYNKKPNIKLGEGIVGIVAQTARPEQVKDVRRDDRYVNRQIAQKEKLCSLLSVPLMVRKRVIGVLNCYTSKPHAFTPTEISVITTVANQAAIVIENSRLLVESQVIREELESKKIIERAKRVLMKEAGLSEEQAFRKIQKHSMDTRKPLREIAESILTAEAMRT